MYSYYLGWVNVSILPLEAYLKLTAPLRFVMDGFSEDVGDSIFGETIDIVPLSIPQVLFGYVVYRMFLAKVRQQFVVASWRQHLFYVCYIMLLWPAVWVSVVTFLTAIG